VHVRACPRRCEHTHAHRTHTHTRTRCCRNAKLPALTDTHPTNVILLTCDGFGVLPPVTKLTREQARSAPPRAHRDRRWRRWHAPVRANTSRTAQVIYHFIQGVHLQDGGTEVGISRTRARTHARTHAHAQVGISETTAAFSSCYGEPFLVW
jgi:ATP-dependent phosphoenolpyruvate carboxykinase